MAYHDGTLEIVSPRLLRTRRASSEACEPSSRRSRRASGSRLTTGPERDLPPRRVRGVTRERARNRTRASTSRMSGRLPRDREIDLDAGDPPPDLWIEVDDRLSSTGTLARLCGTRCPGGLALSGPEEDPCGSSVWSAVLTSRSIAASPCRCSRRPWSWKPWALGDEPLRVGMGPAPPRMGRPGRSPCAAAMIPLILSYRDEFQPCPPSKATSPHPPAGSRSSRRGSTR